MVATDSDPLLRRWRTMRQPSAAEQAASREAHCFLPYEVRKGLTKAGWTEVHQHQLKAWNRCHSELGFTLKNREGAIDAAYPLVVLLGSVFHAGLADPDPDWLSPQWWYTKFLWVRATHPRQEYRDLDKSRLTRSRIEELCLRMTQPLPGYGDRSVGHLGAALLGFIRETYTIEFAERNIRYIDGQQTAYPIVIDGTIDLGLRTRKGKLAIVDAKSFGFWSCLLDPRGGTPPKTNNPGAGEQCYDSQNRHYAYIMRLCGEEPAYVGRAFPGNLVPNQQGPKKGLMRGRPVVIEPLPDGALDDYASGLRGQLTLASHGCWPKTFPNDFGKPYCLRCAFRPSCHGEDPTAGDSLADLAASLYGEE